MHLSDGEVVTGRSLGFFWNFYTLEVDLHVEWRGDTRVIPARMLRKVEKT